MGCTPDSAGAKTFAPALRVPWAASPGLRGHSGTLAQATSYYARSVDYTLEPEHAGVLLKLQADAWEANVHASAEELLLLADIRAASWDERRSIQAGESAGARVWDVSVAVPYAVIDQVVQALRSL